MNIGALQFSPSHQTWTTSRAEDKEPDFLSLRLLNKRTRIRISPSPIDHSSLVGRCNYFSVGKSKAWFAAIIKSTDGSHALALSPLKELQSGILDAPDDVQTTFSPKRVLPLSHSAPPTIVAFALRDERLLVGFGDSSVAVYDTGSLLSEGNQHVDPLSFFPNSENQGPLLQIHSNPGDLAELVIILRESVNSNNTSVEVLDVQQLRTISGWKDGPSGSATCVSWSPKGKQLAIGLQSGEIVTYSPTDVVTAKQHVARPPQAENHSIVSIIWLTNSAFYGIYIPAGSKDPEVAQRHFLVQIDAKTNSASAMEFISPYYPSPALRPAGAFSVIMRNWDPAKFLLFIADSTSSDIGLIGCLNDGGAGEKWANLSLEETSTPSVPLDSESNDTVPLALELDVTDGGSSGEALTPVMILYASDGTLQAWNIRNSQRPGYPAMALVPSNAPVAPSIQISEPSATPSVKPSQFGTSSFGAAPTFGTSGFGTTTQSQATAKPIFGGSSGFGTSGFGGTSTPQPAFGSTSGFGAFASSQSSFATPSSTSGFGAFASQTPSAFGSSPSSAPSSTPFNTTAQLASPPTNAASPESEMDDGEDNSSLGGLSLGSSNTVSVNDNARNSMFGTQTTSSSSNSQQDSLSSGTLVVKPATGFGGYVGSATSPFNSQQNTGSGDAVVKPATGFGAFGSSGTSSFTKPNAGFGAFSGFGSGSSPTAGSLSSAGNAQGTASASPAFGSSGFGTMKPATPFGQPSFGQPAFGAPSFGQSAFGAPKTSATSSSSTPTAFGGASGGFGAFASSGSSGFGSALKVQPTPSISMSTSSDDDKAASLTPISDAPKTVFGGGQVTSSPFGSSPISTPPTTTVERKEDPTSNATQTSNTPESPKIDDKQGFVSQSAAAAAQPPSTPFGSTTTSAFKSSQPASGFGAFANIKPAQGFGAFNSSGGAFANPKPLTVSAFGTGSSVFGTGTSGSSSATTTPTKAGSTTPTFGSPSTFGTTSVFGKSSFGSPTTPTKPSTTNASVVSVFPPASSSGFGSFASSGGSGSFAAAVKAQVAGKSEEIKGYDVTPDEPKETTKLTVETPAGEFNEDNLPPTPSTHGTFDEDEEAERRAEVAEDIDEFLGSSSSEDEGSDANSEDEAGEDVDGGEEEEAEEEDQEEEEEEKKKEEVVKEAVKEAIGRSITPPSVKEADDRTPKAPSSSSLTKEAIKSPTKPLSAFAFGKPNIPDSLSSSKESKPVGLSGDSEKVSVTLEAPVEKDQKTGTPSFPGFGAAFGQTPSLSPSPPTTAKTPSVSQPSISFGASTTPPGSPAKNEESPSPAIASPKPIPATSTSSSNASALGLGRPSSRPVRSSPLSGAPVSNSPSPVPVPTTPTSHFTLKPRPASPKTPFGQLPVKTEPVTPPISHTPPATWPPAPPIMKTETPAKPLSVPSFNLTPSTSPTPFKFPTPTSTSTPSPPVNLFAAGDAPFIMPTIPPAMPSLNMTPTQPSMNQRGGSLPATNLFGASPSSQQPKQYMQQPPAAKLTPPPIPPQQQFESAMQEDCQSIYLLMTKELDVLKKLAGDCNARRLLWGKPALPKHSRADIGDPSKWSMGDLDIFGKMVKSLATDVKSLYDLKELYEGSMKEVESNLLKAETRKEEIVRFSKAKADPEFAKMLRGRTLAPEHVETQNQLRKHIRSINDRVEQLEIHLKEGKKRLEEEKRGRHSIRPPSLDTVNRSYRNIDRAIEDQTEKIASLSNRVAQLNLSMLDSSRGHQSSPLRKPRGRYGLHDDEDEEGAGSVSALSLKGHQHQRSWSGQALFRPEVTPDIAATTAAALNAERSAQRLKDALARARKTPLLNTQAVEPALPAPTLDDLRRSLSANQTGGSPVGLSASTTITQLHPPSSSLDIADLDLPSSSSAELRINRRERTAAHQKSVPLNPAHKRVPSTISNFDWGPLPNTNLTKPAGGLPFDLRSFAKG